MLFHFLRIVLGSGDIEDSSPVFDVGCGFVSEKFVFLSLSPGGREVVPELDLGIELLGVMGPDDIVSLFKKVESKVEIR